MDIKVAAPTRQPKTGRGGSSWRQKARTVGYPVMSLAVFIGAWALWVLLFKPSELVLPSPLAVWDSLVQWRGTLEQYTRMTLVETLLGFGLAAGAGLLLGMLLAFSAWARSGIYPLLVGSQMVPKVALAPIFLIWFGVGVPSKVAIAFLTAFFPIVVSTTLGMRQVRPETIRSSGRCRRGLGRRSRSCGSRRRCPASSPA